MRRSATVLRRVGNQLTLGLGGGETIIASGNYAVGDTVVVVFERGSAKTSRAGSRAAVEGIGTFTLLPNEQLPAGVSLRLERPAATEPEPDFGSNHRPVPNLLTFEYARSLLP